jgi:hypothetical protein
MRLNLLGISLWRYLNKAKVTWQKPTTRLRPDLASPTTVGKEDLFPAGYLTPVAYRRFILYGYENIYGCKPRF